MHLKMLLSLSFIVACIYVHFILCILWDMEPNGWNIIGIFLHITHYSYQLGGEEILSALAGGKNALEYPKELLLGCCVLPNSGVSQIEIGSIRRPGSEIRWKPWPLCFARRSPFSCGRKIQSCSRKCEWCSSLRIYHEQSLGAIPFCGRRNAFSFCLCYRFIVDKKNRPLRLCRQRRCVIGPIPHASAFWTFSIIFWSG